MNAFIDLTEAGELEPYESLLDSVGAGACAYHRVPVRDLNVPSPEEMHRILDLLESER